MAHSPSHDSVAEIWLASDLPHRPTRIAGGPHEGQTIGEVIGRPFPLLAKFIDAALPLSIQVHPNDDLAQARGLARGKSEAWVVLHAQPGSRIYAGLNEGVDAATLAAALVAGRVDDVFFSFEPMVGDVISLPAGTVHALGGGVTIFEIQQSSDVTYRLYDWGRVDPTTGQPRQLHVAEGIACLAATGPVRPCAGGASLITPYFELHVHRAATTLGGDGRARLLIAYGGPATGCVEVPDGRAVLLPSADGECRATPAPRGWLFECVVPN